MSSRVSPTTDRDTALMATLLAVVTGLATAAAGLAYAAALATLMLGGPWRAPGPGAWAGTAIGVATHPGDPAAGLGPPYAAALAAHPGAFWATAIGLLAAVITALYAAGTPLWRRFGPTGAGHATRSAIHAELSLDAARDTAEWTRPSLTPAQRRAAPLTEVAAPLHRAPHGPVMCTPLENPTGTLAPTQSGKSRRDLVHKALAAPGALLCSTTKPDLIEFTALARTRRPNAGPVLVYDTTGTVKWPATLRWSPVQGCEDPDTAYRRAHTMVEAAAVSLSNVAGGNDKVFRERAKVVLQSYFLAAALHRRTVADLVRWAVSKPPDQEPVKLLHDAGYPDHARNLRAEIGMVAETSDAVWLSVRRVIEPFLSDRMRTLASPAAGEAFDVAEFIAAGGSLYLVAGAQQAAQAAPVLTALVEHWLTTAQDMALTYGGNRCDPVVSAVLDEITNATPVPQLPDIVSDSAGRGVLIHWAAQSMAKLEDVFTPQRTRQLLDNTTTLSVWGGIKDERTLHWVSTLTGHHDRRRYQQHTDGLFSPGRTAVGTETVPTYRPGDVRRVARGRVLVIHRHLDPILARTVDVKHRDDWPALRADVATVRAGTAPVDAAGHTHPATAVEADPPAWGQR